MTTLEQIVYETGRSVGVGDVEALLAQASERASTPCEWHLDLGSTQHIQPLAGHRLAALLRELAGQRLKVTLPIPDGGARYRVLYRSGLVAAIAAHAHEVVGVQDESLERLIEEPHAELRSPNVLLFNRVDDGTLVLDKNRFAARLWAAMADSLPQLERRVNEATRAALIETGYEGVANVVDHAFRRPFDGRPERAAFCVLSWQSDMTANPDDTLGLKRYLDQANAELRRDGLRWLMLTIVDDGNGIPARQALDATIYSRPVAEEEEALATALRDGASIKLASADAEVRGDPGWGLSLLAGALEDARGYCCIRTGRQLVEIDAFAATHGWSLRPEVLAPLRGTVLQVVLPAEDPQLQLV